MPWMLPVVAISLLLPLALDGAMAIVSVQTSISTINFSPSTFVLMFFEAILVFSVYGL
jgi:hypothetical protein